MSVCSALRLPNKCATNSFKPPLAWKVSVRSSPGRSSVSVIVIPLLRNDSSRRRLANVPQS